MSLVERLAAEGPHYQGRVTRMPVALGARPLTSEEVSARSAREDGIQPTPVRRLSARHRKLAQLLADGVAPSVAAHAVGLTASRVSILKSDPTFQELLALRQQEKDVAFLSFNERLAALGEDAADELQDRLSEEPDSFTTGELMDLTRMTADRTGNGPKKVEEKNITVNFGDRLEAARKRAAVQVIDAVVSDITEEVA